MTATLDETQAAIRSSDSITPEVIRVRWWWFWVTAAVCAAILVAGLGVVSTLITLIHDRKREVALLALLGATARQLRRMVVIEAVLIGAVSQLVGVVMGVLLAVVLIYVINVQSFGWTIQFHLPVVFLLQSTLLILAATALCGLFPAMRAARVDALQTVREE